MSTDDDIEHMVAFGAGLVSTRENQDQTDLVVVFPDNAVERMRAEAESVAAATIQPAMDAASAKHRRTTVTGLVLAVGSAIGAVLLIDQPTAWVFWTGLGVGVLMAAVSSSRNAALPDKAQAGVEKLAGTYVKARSPATTPRSIRPRRSADSTVATENAPSRPRTMHARDSARPRRPPRRPARKPRRRLLRTRSVPDVLRPGGRRRHRRSSGCHTKVRSVSCRTGCDTWVSSTPTRRGSRRTVVSMSSAPAGWRR